MNCKKRKKNVPGVYWPSVATYKNVFGTSHNTNEGISSFNRLGGIVHILFDIYWLISLIT